MEPFQIQVLEYLFENDPEKFTDISPIILKKWPTQIYRNALVGTYGFENEIHPAIQFLVDRGYVVKQLNSEDKATIIDKIKKLIWFNEIKYPLQITESGINEREKILEKRRLEKLANPTLHKRQSIADIEEASKYTRDVQLLKILSVYGEEVPINITPDIQNLYKEFPETISNEVATKWTTINEELSSLDYRRLVNGIVHFETESDGTKVSIKWKKMTAFLTGRGTLFLNKLVQQERDELSKKLSIATLAANQATIESFAETKKSNEFQRKTQWLTITIGFISAIGTVAAAVIALNGNAGKKPQLQTEMQALQKQVQDLQKSQTETRTVLQDLKNATEKKKIDSAPLVQDK